MMCRLLEVTVSGFYAWCRRGASRRSRDNQRPKRRISAIHAELDGVDGSPKIRDELLEASERVARLMRELELKGCPKTRYKAPTNSDHGFAIAPNRLKRDFMATAPNQRWVADITYRAPGSRRHLGRCCRGASMSGMYFDFHKDEGRRMPAICYEVARAEAAVTCRALAG
jgi:transposase InsO family protein